MDTNLMSCPTCGHSVSNVAGACAYCGAMMAEAGQPPPADNKDAGGKAQVAASPPPLPQAQTRPADKIFDEAAEIPLAAKEHPESDVSQPPTDSPATAETLAPAPEVQAVSAGEWTSVEEESESEPAVDEQKLKSAPESGRLNQDLEDNSETAPTDAVGPESVPDAAAEPVSDHKPGIQEPQEGETISAPDKVIPIDRPENPAATATADIQPPPQPAVADISGAESAESEALAEKTGQPIEIEATRQASAGSPTPEMSAPPGKTVKEAETKPGKDISSKKKADLSDDAKAGAAAKSLGDTIVLEAEDEVEAAAAVSPDTTEGSAPPESRAEAQSKNGPKAGLTKAQTLNNQKAALAKAHALKKQKLVLAKAAALKRKKAIQAKAQAETEAAKKKVSAAAALAPKSDPGPEANTRIQTLLEKYKDRVIGINYDHSADIRKAQLVEANAEYFSVFVKDQNLKYTYPLKSILSVIEGKEGVDIGSSKEPKKFIAVIKVYPLVLF